MKKIDLIAAARPNFMKIAPLFRALSQEKWCETRIVHTGQHYDANMSDWFFRDLGLPPPTVNLDVGSGSHAQQTGGVMIAYEKWCLENRPDWTIVVGDVNSTIATALASTKLGIRVAHLEAGLRSGDRSMPEEINRIATDSISDLLWTPSQDANDNLAREGVPSSRIDLVGNIMIDSLEMVRPAIDEALAHAKIGVAYGQYGVVTLHRPSNVDDPIKLAPLVRAILAITERCEIVFPVHPRTRQRLIEFGLWSELAGNARVKLLDPLGYIEFMSLVVHAAFVLTDSGGIQEETTYLHVPCLTLRENTERPVTVTLGTNRLITLASIDQNIDAVFGGRWPTGVVPEKWDGRTADRVVASLRARLE